MSKKTLAIIVIIIIIIIAGFVYFYKNPSFPSDSLSKMYGTEKAKKGEVLPPATGNVDDAVDAIISDALNESNLLVNENYETEIINIDSNELDALGQSTADYEKQI